MLEEMSPNQRIRYAFTLFVFAGAFAVIDIPLIIVMSFVHNLSHVAKALIEVHLSAPLAALFTRYMYVKFLLPSLPDEG
jgi:hypothetical protein